MTDICNVNFIFYFFFRLFHFYLALLWWHGWEKGK